MHACMHECMHERAEHICGYVVWVYVLYVLYVLWGVWDAPTCRALGMGGEQVDGQMMFQGYWFYRPSELKRPPKDMLRQELVLSDWADENPVESVLSKAPVLFVKGIMAKSALLSCAGGAFKVEGKSYAHLCCRQLVVKSSKVMLLTDKRIGHGVSFHQVADAAPVCGGAHAGKGGGAPGAAGDAHAAMRAAAGGLTELRAGGAGMRAEGWVPSTQRSSAWGGIKQINRSHRLTLEAQGLDPAGILQVRAADAGRITAMALSPNAQYLATVCLGGVVCVWDAQSKQLLKHHVERLPGQHKVEFESVAFTHDGARLVVAGAVRHRHELVAGLEVNVHKLISGFIREYTLELCNIQAARFVTSQVVTSSQTTTLQTLHVGRGPLTALTPAWSEPVSPSAAEPSPAGAGFVFARVPPPPPPPKL